MTDGIHSKYVVEVGLKGTDIREDHHAFPSEKRSDFLYNDLLHTTGLDTRPLARAKAGRKKKNATARASSSPALRFVLKNE